ncbi:hypothetical protein XA68_16279 [Ophiocordyceps unilateralis]|uniref:WSC domain-containing protein n=1 Tax=Ophiocordyceps unilateralis TaxID=268505 RepID=A0A2A9P6M9_OPHUN|nr:hypothetical protein XA68_16279 [Ophiocordyceps unilateralis]
MKTSAIALAALAAASQAYATLDLPTLVNRDLRATLVERQAKGQQKPSVFPLPNAQTSHGCYKSQGNMTTHDVQHLSSGSCNDVCKAGKFWVSGLQGSQCFCGFAYPPQKDIVDDEKCNYPCPSYPLEACGGLADAGGFWSVFNTGVNVNAKNFESSSTTSSSSQSTNSQDDQDPSVPSVVTQTHVTTQGPNPDEKKGGANTAGIAAGAVAGLVVAAALVGGLIFYLRRKRNAQIEEEHRRNAAVSAFINGSKPPGSSGSMSMTDARLDPVMVNRRMSDGSIADNEDYSRRILRVTNA